MELSLSQRLERYLKKNPRWFPKGELCDIAREATGAIGEQTGRRLREMAEEGTLLVKHEKNHAWYKYNDNNPIDHVQKAIEIFDKLP